MSGICAVASFQQNHPPHWPRHTVQTMLPALASSFSDTGRLWSSEQAALGRTLTPLLPEDAFDRQPVYMQHQAFTLVAQVRLDNRRELARELALPHPETLADSSLLASAWQRWGMECIDHLLGGFAFCVWDERARELFAARDPAGEFPLFFYRGSTFIALASAGRALRLIPGVPRGFDEQRIADLLIGAAQQRTSSYFENIERLPAGHLLRATSTAVQTRQYWHPSKAKPVRFKRDAEYVETFTDLFDRSIEPRLRTSGTVAAHLSAGLDSSSVAASAALLLAAQGKGLTAYTSVPQPAFQQNPEQTSLTNEGPAAAEVVALYPNMRHEPISTEDINLVPALRRIIERLDEPVINATNWLWLLAISERAREQGAGVMLQGPAGNGTVSYETIRPFVQMFRQGHWIKLAQTVLKHRAMGFTSFHASAQVVSSALYPQALKRHLQRQQDDSLFRSLPINPEFATRFRLREAFRNPLASPKTDSDEQCQMYEHTDLAPGNSACVALGGVDPRDPTSDQRLWEFCCSIPPEQYVAGGLPRSLIRRAMRGRLPPSTLTRTTSGLQSADWHLTVAKALPALREQLALIAESTAVQHFLNVRQLEQLIESFPTSGFHRTEVYEVAHLALLRGITLGMFLHRHDPQVPGSKAAS